MSVHSYIDDCGSVGEPRIEDEPDPLAEADEAMRELLSAVDELGKLTDRHGGDSGADAALIEGWTERVERLCEEVRMHLGEPRESIG